MAITDLTSLISPGMRLVRSEQAVMQLQTSRPSGNTAAYNQAERELRDAIAELEREGTEYNQLVDNYNTAKSAAEQALLEPLIQEQANRYNTAVREYNRIGNQYQSSGIITGFSVVDELTPEKAKPTLSQAPEGIIQGKSDVAIPTKGSGEPLGILGAVGVVRDVFRSEGLRKSQDLFSDVTTGIKGAVDFIQTPANASEEKQAALKLQRQDFLSGILNTVFPVAPDNLISDVSDKLTGKTDAQILQEQKDYMTNLGISQIGLGAAFSKVSPQIGQLFTDSGKEVLVSRDFQTEGLISKNDMGGVQINRPSVYDIAAFGGVLGAAGAAAGTGAVTGVSGFGPLISKAAPLAIEGETVASYITGGGKAGTALINAAAADNAAKTSLAGLSAFGLSLSEVDYGIGDILDQYPRRDEERGVTVPMPGEVGIGNGILDEYPSRDKYGSGNRNQYNRNNNNRNEDWNRSELDYRGNVGSGYSTRLVEDNLYRSRYQEANQNRYRNEYDYLYEFATVADAFPRSRRRASYEEEEEDFIAEPRRKGKRKKSRFTERLIL